MIYKADANLKKRLFPIFKDMDDTMILSCLQGYMGEAFVDDPESPEAAQVLVGMFVFYAGNPYSKGAQELLTNLPEESIVIVKTYEWKKRVETVHKGYIDKFERYAFKKNMEALKTNHIRAFLKELPEGYELRKMDKKLAYSPSLKQLAEYFTSQYESIDDYLQKGVGYCILHKGKIVCCASSYSVYDGGIEIEIDTLLEYRRKGLAKVAASALILYCLERGIYPSWDAANKVSASFAQELGYILDKSYDAYYINYKK